MRTPPTARLIWIARCVTRLKRQYARGAWLPGGDRGLMWIEYARLVEQILAEYESGG